MIPCFLQVRGLALAGVTPCSPGTFRPSSLYSCPQMEMETLTRPCAVRREGDHYPSLSSAWWVIMPPLILPAILAIKPEKLPELTPGSSDTGTCTSGLLVLTGLRPDVPAHVAPTCPWSWFQGTSPRPCRSLGPTRNPSMTSMSRHPSMYRSRSTNYEWEDVTPVARSFSSKEGWS